MPSCVVRPLERMSYDRALALQAECVAGRKLGEMPDQLLLLEHPHVITLGRNGRMENLLACKEVLEHGLGINA